MLFYKIEKALGENKIQKIDKQRDKGRKRERKKEESVVLIKKAVQRPR